MRSRLSRPSRPSDAATSTLHDRVLPPRGEGHRRGCGHGIGHGTRVTQGTGGLRAWTPPRIVERERPPRKSGGHARIRPRAEFKSPPPPSQLVRAQEASCPLRGDHAALGILGARVSFAQRQTRRFVAPPPEVPDARYNRAGPSVGGSSDIRSPASQPDSRRTQATVAIRSRGTVSGMSRHGSSRWW